MDNSTEHWAHICLLYLCIIALSIISIATSLDVQRLERRMQNVEENQKQKAQQKTPMAGVILTSLQQRTKYSERRL